ncbi:bifunctional adenosylcobinamide kinase/adenosylcobinamide-phosphate guanylyltransferase [Corynebacterium aquilae]|uniref:Adenosylcobinamide kinase n=1 Tax=Corynebacterium aquilae DSM 44791 TaxID=1431546 RepID=A0A1L7CH24_9CORY|nr:bifunctional adenosylcobinamide kinase/adenosylcobinamide-phosphate guanylyltransferase [Corynebacterium aquilae]APT85129.1 hypothetical protein CAQU_08655 [Corynebacterium aquilae DSM 44791]
MTKTLVLGGARSGKSDHAEGLIGDRPCTYVATARPWPGDADFAARIARHIQRRPAHWVTEDRINATEVLTHPENTTGCVLIDDMGTWLTHLIDERDAWSKPRGTVADAADAFLAALRDWPADRDVVIVSPEVGMGVIPEHASARLFRDEIGLLNARIAQECDHVLLVVAGLALELK